jgi:hypothetical protein
MRYEPIVKEEDKKNWIKWLDSQVEVLNGRSIDKNDNDLFRTGDGDIATAKDLVGNLYATLSGKAVEIRD